MLDAYSTVRTLVFAVIYAGIEYHYVNRRESPWTKEIEGFYEKPLFWKVTPYQALLLLPMFIVVSYSGSLTAWAGNTFLLAVVEDMAYFVWRRKGVVEGEWTTTLFGSFRMGGLVVPNWWVLGGLVSLFFFLVPL